MKINLSGHHVEITEGIETIVQSKFQKVGSHYPDLMDLAVIIKVDRHEHSAEVSTHYQGASMSVTATDKDMYAAIQSTAKKLEAALSKRKGALLADRNEKPLGEPVENANITEESAEFLDEAANYSA
ncbi:MAG: putative sigma-54 modulation protein [Oleiphilaceae bacterium]|jgi:putative sigma-54 modulation protein